MAGITSSGSASARSARAGLLSLDVKLEREQQLLDVAPRLELDREVLALADLLALPVFESQPTVTWWPCASWRRGTCTSKTLLTSLRWLRLEASRSSTEMPVAARARLFLGRGERGGRRLPELLELGEDVDVRADLDVAHFFVDGLLGLGLCGLGERHVGDLGLGRRRGAGGGGLLRQRRIERVERLLEFLDRRESPPSNVPGG